MSAGATLAMSRITKRFPGVLANDQVDFYAQRGEIHALLGENGAGKSTLMNILTGLYWPDEGEISIDGKVINFRAPRDAVLQGVGMVHQHFRLVRTFTVAENITLGMGKEGFWWRPQVVEQKVAALATTYGMAVEPKAKIWQLSVGEQQRVEIMKMLYRGAQILILDEPTAVLTPQEVKELFRNLRQLADSGKTIIFITHKLHEVMSYADRITVLRNGRSVAVREKEQTSIKELAQLMVGRELSAEIPRPATKNQQEILRLEEVCALNDKCLPSLRKVSFAVNKGEILAFAGVAGNGQRELAEVITGLRPVTSGRFWLHGKDVTSCSARQLIDAGVGHIPEDRKGMGLVPNMAIMENTILKSYRDRSVCPGYWLDHKAIRQRAEQLVTAFGVKTATLDSPVRLMSGGNLQKLLLAREVSAGPGLIIAVYPVRGLDVAATETIHQLLVEQRNQGIGILLVSEDLDEIFKLADRVAVMFAGQIMGILPIDQANLDEVGLMMAGARASEVGMS
ncbi:MAG: Galactose/methyl galactoside import ATP-binding protein MglA [Firmicutes bacterium]|nr:Galactose/methyl galactoside import ATP-binding protein MglA [Bacillota bacterium]